MGLGRDLQVRATSHVNPLAQKILVNRGIRSHLQLFDGHVVCMAMAKMGSDGILYRS